MPNDDQRLRGVRATAVFLLLRAWTCEAARPLRPYEAPLLAPFVATEALVKWQPAEWSIAFAPSSEDTHKSLTAEDTVSDDSLDLIDGSDASGGGDHARWLRAVARRARDVSIEPIAAAVALKREGWTGASIQSSASFSLANDVHD
jgi:hypothetical protein